LNLKSSSLEYDYEIEEEFLNSKNTLLTSFWFYNELKLLNLKNQRADLFCSF
jgi:hypothetical protein